MQKKFNGILIHSKVFKDNDLLIKFLSDTDEVFSGIVYGGLSKNKKNIMQLGFFLNLDVTYIGNRPPSIKAELSKPYLSSVINDKYKLSCLLSVVSLINASVIEGQKINQIYKISKEFLEIMINKKKWLNFFCIYLFDLLKYIGYELDYVNNNRLKYFDTDTLEFKENYSNYTIDFPHHLFVNNSNVTFDYNSLNNFFKIFEIIFIKNHLSNLNHKLPNQYILFKKNIISFLEKNEQNNWV